MAQEDLTLRMRTRGARSTQRDVETTGRTVRTLGDNAEHAAKKSALLGKTTGLLARPFHHLRGEVSGLAKSFIGMGIAFGSVEGIHKAIETTDDLVKTTVQLHHQFGLTTESASGLAGVLAARNLAPQGLRMGLIALSKQMQAVASGNDQAAEAFNYVGVSADEIRAALGSRDGLEHIFERVTSAMTALPGGANKAAYGQMLFGRASKSLAPLLQEGALGLEQQLKWAKEYGVTLDGHTVGSVEEMAAAQTKAQYAALGLQIQLGQFLAPALTTVNETFADVVKSFREGQPQGNGFARTIYDIGHDLEPLGKGLADVGGYLKDHPMLLEASAGAWLAWKTGLVKILGFGGGGLLRLLTSRRGPAGGGGLAGALTGRGSTPANPLYVWSVNGRGGIPGGEPIPPVVPGGAPEGPSVLSRFVRGAGRVGEVAAVAEFLHLGQSAYLAGGKNEFQRMRRIGRSTEAGMKVPTGSPPLVGRDRRGRVHSVLVDGHAIPVDPRLAGYPDSHVVFELHHTTVLPNGKVLAKETVRQAVKAKSVR